jgi:hypothetical protein
MSPPDIETHSRAVYGATVGRDLISRITDAVVDDVREWQNAEIEGLYSVLSPGRFMVSCVQRSIYRVGDGESAGRRRLALPRPARRCV